MNPSGLGLGEADNPCRVLTTGTAKAPRKKLWSLRLDAASSYHWSCPSCSFLLTVTAVPPGGEPL